VKKFIYKNNNFLFVSLLCFLSLSFNFYYGYKGILPIDSFLTFDSGYNVLNGSYPFKDYWTITGPLLDYFQAFFFLIFGVNWFSYVLHASTINLILAVFSYFIFIRLELNKIYSFIYSASISLLAYPNIGTPFIDHHSTIFSIFAIYCFILTIKKDNSYFWFSIPLLLGCSFLSKQIPAAYIIIFIFITFLFYFFYYFNKNAIFFIIYGFLFALTLFLFIMLVNQIPFSNFTIQYILYPASIGFNRFENLNFSLKEFILQFKYIYICLLPLLLVFFKIIFKNKKFQNKKKDFVIILLIIGMTLIFIYTQLITRNQILIFFLIPIITAFSHIYFINYFKKNFFIYLIIFICFFAVAKYHFRYNEHKKFMDLANVDLNLAVDAGSIHKMFNGLKWITPHYSENPEKEVKNLIEIKKYLRDDQKNKIVISDYQFFAAISNFKFSSPNKWYDDMSVPSNKNKYFSNYKIFFIKKLKKNKVEKIYIIDKNKSLYIENFIDNKSCINSQNINEMLLVYDITNCNL